MKNQDRIPGTCEWLLDHEKYKYWRQDPDSRLLWISADAGCGKSFWASFLVDKLRNSDVVCYFFFKDDNERQRSATSALCALLHQLFSARPPLVIHAMAEFWNKGQKFTEGFGTLWGILMTATTDPSCGNVICVVDGLDECEESTRVKLVNSLVRFYEMHGEPSTNKMFLKFIITSRPDTSIERRFRALPTIRLKAEDEVDAINSDIKLVVKVKLRMLASMRGLSGDVQTNLEDRLINNAGQTFLWVSLILELIENSARVSRKVLDNMLSTIPSTLDAVYNKILQQSTNSEDAKKVLHILVAAVRPLTLREMNVAFAIRDGNKSYEGLDLEPHICDTIKNLCGPFVRIINSTIYLAHQTAKEFLIKSSDEAISSPGSWRHSLRSVESNRVLAEICILYLLFDVFESHPLVMHPEIERQDIQKTVAQYTNRHVFLDYAAKHWADHFREAKIRGETALLKSALNICNTQSKRFLAWFQVYWVTINSYSRCPQDFTDLMVGSYFGHEVAVRLLLEHGADVKAKNGNGWAALYGAASNGHETVVRLLLESKADINTEDEFGWTALHGAAANGHESVVQLLLEHNAVVNTKNRRGWTALYQAAANGHEAVVRLLLEHKADINAKDWNGWTALHGAAANRHEAVVRLLLEHKADINAKDRNGWTALYRAAATGHESIVRLLLKYEADINAKDMSGWTALYRAAANGHESVVRLLLEHRACVNAKDKNGRTVLYRVVENKHESLVLLLLEHKADVQTKNEFGWTALHRAVANEHEAVVRLLLEHKADVNARDKGGWAALHWATNYRLKAVVRLLLEHKADIDAKNNSGQTALYQAVEKKDDEIVRILLEHKADIDANNNSG
jgi:ankyrin repeat domain-containing protein 50